MGINILHISVQITPFFDEVERRNGYLAALKDHNYPIIEQAITLNTPDFEGGEKAMIDLLSYNKKSYCSRCL